MQMGVRVWISLEESVRQGYLSCGKVGKGRVQRLLGPVVECLRGIYCYADGDLIVDLGRGDGKVEGAQGVDPGELEVGAW